MFSIKKQISKISPDLFLQDNISRFDIFSLNYSLVFQDPEHKINFFQSIAFYFAIDNYVENNKNYITVSDSILDSNPDTGDFIIVNSHKNLRKISSMECKPGGDTISYQKCKFIQPALDCNTSSLESILSYLEKEISFAYDESSLYLEQHNVKTDSNTLFLKDLCNKTSSLFRYYFSPEYLIDIPGLVEASIIHSNKYMQNTIPTNDNNIKGNNRVLKF